MVPQLENMTLKQFLAVFGGFGLFMGSFAAVPLFVASGGRIIPSLLMLLFGLAVGFACGLYRVIQLRYSATARAKLAAQPQPSFSSVVTPHKVIIVLLGFPPMFALALHSNPLVHLAALAPLLVAVAVQSRRKGPH